MHLYHCDNTYNNVHQNAAFTLRLKTVQYQSALRADHKSKNSSHSRYTPFRTNALISLPNAAICCNGNVAIKCVRSRAFYCLPRRWGPACAWKMTDGKICHCMSHRYSRQYYDALLRGFSFFSLIVMFIRHIGELLELFTSLCRQ